MQTKYDVWSVRDAAGLIHTAKVGRFYNGGSLRAIQVATACHPAVKQVTNDRNQDWSSAALLPQIVLADFVITEWRLREDPTCIACMSVADAFRS